MDNVSEQELAQEDIAEAIIDNQLAQEDESGDDISDIAEEAVE